MTVLISVFTWWLGIANCWIYGAAFAALDYYRNSASPTSQCGSFKDMQFVHSSKGKWVYDNMTVVYHITALYPMKNYEGNVTQIYTYAIEEFYG